MNYITVVYSNESQTLNTLKVKLMQELELKHLETFENNFNKLMNLQQVSISKDGKFTIQFVKLDQPTYSMNELIEIIMNTCIYVKSNLEIDQQLEQSYQTLQNDMEHKIWIGQPILFLDESIDLKDQQVYRVLKNNSHQQTSILEKIQEIYINAMDQIISTQPLVPLQINPNQILDLICSLQLGEYNINALDQDQTEQIIKEKMRPFVLDYEEKINQLNQFTLKILSKDLDSLIKLLKIPDKISLVDIQQIVEKAIEVQIQPGKIPPIFEMRIEEYRQQFSIVQSSLIFNMLKFLKTIVKQLCKIQVQQSEFFDFLNAQLVDEIPKVCEDLKCFDDIELFQKVKSIMFIILQEVNFQYFKCSVYCVDQMNQLDQHLKNYPSLANIQSYQMFQKQISKNILNEIGRILDKESYFFRPEFEIFKTALVQHIIGYFSDYSISNQNEFKPPFKPRLFKDVVKQEIIKYAIQFPYQENGYVYSFDIRSDYSDCLIYQNLFLLEFDRQFIDYTKQKKYQVTRIQNYSNKITQQIAVCVELEYDNKKYCYLIETNDSDDIFIIRSIFWLNINNWIPFTQIQQSPKIDLQDFLKQRLKMKDYYKQKVNEILDIQEQKFIESQDTEEVVVNKEEDLNKYKQNRIRQLLPINQYSQGMQTAKALSGGCIGAGLGSLILDSLDDSIPWDQKLKRAGYTTVQTGMLSMIFISLPILSTIFSQVMLTYALKLNFSNQVVNTEIKMQGVANIAVQSTVGIGSAIAGQILIPVPVLGAIIGGTIGGVAAGLYGKFIVPAMKGSIQKMIQKLQTRIQPNGLVIYTDEIVKILKINSKHFDLTKPKNLTQSEWLTVILVFLTNEVYYLLNLENQKETVKISEKMIDDPQNPKLLKNLEVCKNQMEEIEKNLAIWDESRKFIQRENIKLMSIIEKIGQFVDGMIKNFKV